MLSAKRFHDGMLFLQTRLALRMVLESLFRYPDRNINYKKDRHPDWWKNYQTFTRNQLNELMSDYGSFDILWLDGGWVKGDDIGLDDILAQARRKHPGLISVDRSIRGKNENYQTPERGIPETQLNYPWESCITLSNDWGWVPNAPFKSSQKVINILSEITAKGGCLLLGVGPTRTVSSKKKWPSVCTKWENGCGQTAKPSTIPESLLFIRTDTHGSLPTRTDRHSMPSMHCPKEKHCRKS